jgi:hypothetical protein
VFELDIWLDLIILQHGYIALALSSFRSTVLFYLSRFSFKTKPADDKYSRMEVVFVYLVCVA